MSTDRAAQEQRAKELAQQIYGTHKCGSFESGLATYNIERATKLLAAALAACARERDEQLLKAAKAALAEMEDYERHLQLEVFGTKEALHDALRAKA